MYPTDADPAIEIDARAVHAKLQENRNFLLLDCREPQEHATAHIAGAKLVPMSGLSDSLHELEAFRDCDIAVHCHHGGRSLKVARWLREQGFAKAQSMSGGIDQWSLEIDRTVPRY